MASGLEVTELALRVSDESEGDDLVPVSALDPLPTYNAKAREFARATGKSLDNTAFTFTVPADGRVRQVLYALTKYSAAPTETGVTFAITPGAGAIFATTLSTAGANTQNNPYIPGGPLLLLPGDTFTITAPAGGSGIFAYCYVAMEYLTQ